VFKPTSPRTYFHPLPPFDAQSVADERTIFFLETTPPPRMTGRKLCAIESAAVKNPARQVLAILNSDEGSIELPAKWKGKMPSNVRFARLNVTRFIRGNVFLRKVWFETVRTPRFKVIMSDLLRVLFLYNHGGSYFDTDTITFREIPPDLPNFCEASEGFLLPNTVI